MSLVEKAPLNAPGKSSKWLREAGVYGLLYGIPLLILFPYPGWRPDARFQASVRTEAVDFTVSDYKKEGPFLGRCVDIYLENFRQIELPGPQRWQRPDGTTAGGSTENLWSGRVRFRSVDFKSLLLTTGTHVRVVWYEPSPDGVTVMLTYAGKPAPFGAHVFLDERSTVEFQSSRFSESGPLQSGLIVARNTGHGVATIYPIAGSPFPISVSPCAAAYGSPVAAKSSLLGPSTKLTSALHQQAAEKVPTLHPTDRLPLSPGSGMTFLTDAGDNALVGVNNIVQVRNAERKENLFLGQRLEIGRLEDQSLSDPSEITLQIKNGIMVNVLGRAGVLRIDGEDIRPSLAEFLRSRKVLSTWLTTSILLGSALLTIASRIKLVKRD